MAKNFFNLNHEQKIKKKPKALNLKMFLKCNNKKFMLNTVLNGYG